MFVKVVQGILLIVGLTLVGAMLGVVAPLSVGLLFQTPDTWRALPTPPQPASRVLAGDYGVVFIEDTTGQTYRCEIASGDDCWQPWTGEITPDVDVRHPTRWPCPTDLHDDPPGNQAVDLYFEECVPGMMMSSDAAAFRVLPEGRVEAWISGGDGNSWFFAALGVQCLLPLGAVVGLVGAAILIIRRNRPKRPALAVAP